MRQFEFDSEGYAINPETGKRFKYGDNYDDRYFKSYNFINGKRRPHFYTTEAYQRLREKQIGKGTRRTPRECALQIRKNARDRVPEEGRCEIDIELLTEELERGFCDKDGNLIIKYKIATDGNGSRDINSPSLDRIDSSCDDYIFTREYRNCQLVPWVLNTARQNFDNDFLVASVLYPWCRDTLLEELTKRIEQHDSDRMQQQSVSATSFQNITQHRDLNSLSNEELMEASNMWIESNCM